MWKSSVVDAGMVWIDGNLHLCSLIESMEILQFLAFLPNADGIMSLGKKKLLDHHLWIHIETGTTDEADELVETFVGSIDNSGILVILHHLSVLEPCIHVVHGILDAESVTRSEFICNPHDLGGTILETLQLLIELLGPHLELLVIIFSKVFR